MKKQIYGKVAIALIIVTTILVAAGFHQEKTAIALSTVVTTAEATDNSKTNHVDFVTVAEGGIGNGEGGFGGTDWKSLFTPRAVVMLAQTLYGEADGVASDAERSMVIWCILNRYDSGIEWFGKTIEEIIAKPGQFAGYSPNHPITERNIVLVKRVIAQYIGEKEGSLMIIHRTLPKNICFFHSAYDGTNHNDFYSYAPSSDGSIALGGKVVFYGHEPLCNPYDD